MNYPFNHADSRMFRRLMSIALVIVMLTATLSGCSLFQKAEETTEDTSANLPNLIETTEPPTETEAPTEAPTEPEPDNLAIVKEQLNVRSSPSTGSNVTAQLDAGEKVAVLRIEPVNGVQWAYIHAEALNVKGWVSTDLLDMTNVQAAASSPTSTPAGNTEATTEPSKPVEQQGNNNNTTTTTGNGSYGIVTASELNIRSQASSSSDRVGALKYGDRVTILEKSSGWAKIKQGWVSLDYVYVDGGTGKNTTSGTVTASQLLVRSGPGKNYDQVSALSSGTRVEILEQIRVGGTVWGAVKGGWISMDYVDAPNKLGGSTTNNTTNTTPTAGSYTVVGNGLNIRNGAGTNYDIIGGLAKGTVFTISEKTTDGNSTWGRVSNGWVCLDYAQQN